MKYYSEVLRKNYDTVKELEAAEAEHQKKVEAELQKTKELAERVKKAEAEMKAKLKEKAEAKKAIDDAIRAYTKKYGAYVYSWSNAEEDELEFNVEDDEEDLPAARKQSLTTLSDLIDSIFKF